MDFDVGFWESLKEREECEVFFSMFRMMLCMTVDLQVGVQIC